MSRSRVALLSLLGVLVYGCSITSQRSTTVVTAPAIIGAVPGAEPHSAVGNPASYEVFGKYYYPLASSHGFYQRGIASWYGRKFHGRKTSNLEIYDMYAMTAAHKELPLPTYVEVRHLENGNRLVVRVNDRGPFHGQRIIDLSYAAAKALGMLGKGTAMVEIRALPLPPPSVAATPAPQVSAAVGNRYLQVGAFRLHRNALKARNRLRAITATVHIQEIRSTQGVLYRVRIGPLSGLDGVKRLINAVAALGFEPPYVTTGHIEKPQRDGGLGEGT